MKVFFQSYTVKFGRSPRVALAFFRRSFNSFPASRYVRLTFSFNHYYHFYHYNLLIRRLNAIVALYLYCRFVPFSLLSVIPINNINAREIRAGTIARYPLRAVTCFLTFRTLIN
ncbi:hypothetical protein GGTG_08979 [Gaeumannomyces tritici R3-111a-1]|uniref:Uncharacterized protein n=1 Tax=Gaeumannomyces tritici (strain R3-111a-1) TaxID=644352 RepID=J3P638_GAET3|nr:hypothetical protein GGTG_08979 [Gaeumannomyces tritici R3-111a-1]EJT72111.1 hypothetical protein GGTG_08979 [Gaeumannomyces tritici R3-111a-1]